ncbi:MAG: BamA/TamA family outer membrane protein, partial [Bacteroidales bacterium]|nr:BamA/TamA family outer membrane protein [Bacteroidales bacterium]
IRFININFEPLSQTSNDGSGLLDCQIQIGRSNTQIFTIEAEGTNTGGFLGMGSNIVYSNLNLFKGGEVFSLKLKGALEMQKTIGEPETFLFGFNTVETGIEARLEVPRLLVPYVSQQIARYTSPRSTLVTGLNYQRRPDYTRYIANVSAGYEWRQTLTRSHIFIPLELNSVRIFRSDEFSRWLEGLTDKRLINQYTDHLVPLLRYVYVFNNQATKKNRDFMFWRAGVESSGGLINLVDRAVEAPRNELGYFTLFGIRYAQFVRIETDFRYYKVINPKNNIVFRVAAGIGKPYGNSNVLPVEKGFYAGGANGMRGWDIRSLGPGRLNDPENAFDKMGEMWLENNIEYRFPIYSWLNGAVFADAGNIWMLKESIDLPGGSFKVSEIGDHIAVDGGLGIRFDLSFFILRIDGAVKLKNPALELGNQWLSLSDFGIRNITWNFGIGYPF